MHGHLYEVYLTQWILSIIIWAHVLFVCFNTGPLQTVKVHTTSWDITVMLLVFSPTRQRKQNIAGNQFLTEQYDRMLMSYIPQNIIIYWSICLNFFSAICWCLQPAWRLKTKCRVIVLSSVPVVYQQGENTGMMVRCPSSIHWLNTAISCYY